jgi:hypothetical protein
MKNNLFAVLGFLLVFWFVLAGCSTGSDDDGDNNNNNNNSGIVGKWLGGDTGTDQFDFGATTYLFTKTEGKDVSTFSGAYTYTKSDLKLVLTVTGITGYAYFVVQPGRTIEATISWQDDDNFTVVESTLNETKGKKWKRQK